MPDHQPNSPGNTPELEGLDPGELLARGLNTVHPSGGVHGWIPPTPAELARLLPQYHIESMIGHGGMGAVYKGFQEKLARAVAIKILPAELTADQQFVARFEREARTLARLQHPGIVSIYDFGQTTDGHLYFVMEYVEGTDLRRILQGPGLSSEQALEVTVQVCEALHAAHRQGVIHRDIKPANILITSDGRVKLADFGLARPDNEKNDGLTSSNVLLGTPDYMAPEQHAGDPDHRADIFALGLMLYEMLTGQLPRGAWIPPSRKVHVDVRIDEVVIKALQEQPELRYQQASEMKTDVDHIRTSVVESPQPDTRGTPVPPTQTKTTKRNLLMIAIPAFVTLVGLAAVMAPGVSSRPAAVEPASPEAPTPGTTAPIILARAESPTPEPPPPDGSSPVTLDDVLFDFDWQYETTREAESNRPANTFFHSLFFLKDGTVYSRGRKQTWKWSWTITGPRTIHIDQNFRDRTIDLTFNPLLTQFEGKSTDGFALTGSRNRKFTAEEIGKIREQVENHVQEADAEQKSPIEDPERLSDDSTGESSPPQSTHAVIPRTPGPPVAVVDPPPESTPAAVTSAAPSVSIAEEALVGSAWKFESPAHTGELTFIKGGAISKTWKQAFPWRWEVTGDHEFTMKEMGGRRQITRLVFDEKFTSFEGPGFTAGQTYHGKRVTPFVISSQPASPPPEPVAPPVAESKKSSIEVLAENGPFITDQVFSPLDAPSVPEATVSLWIEDLLDEAANQPVTHQQTYQQAAAVLAALKSALRERYKIISDSKFAGAVVDTTDMQSSRKTVLHVWDWLQYQRERDDAAKHERKQERTADFFASGPPRRWNERCAVLRPNVEKLYAAFRKSRRDLPVESPKPKDP